MNKRELFRWESDFIKIVTRIAIPITLQSLLTSLLVIVDNLMVGQLGEGVMASVTQANRVTFWVQITLFGLSGGVSMFASQYWGKQDRRGIERTMGVGLMFGVVIALAFALPSFFAPQAVMRMFLQEAESIREAAGYLRIMSLGYILISINIVLGTVQKSTERAKPSMYASMLGIATNCFLNYMLIFGKLGAPRLGARGAAIATVLAIFVEFLVLVFSGRALGLATWAKLTHLAPGWVFFKRFLSLSWVIVFNEFTWSTGMNLYSMVYGAMGVSAVAAVGIFGSFEQLISVALRGITSACAVIVGKQIGEERKGEAYASAARLLALSTGVAILAGLVQIGISGWVVHLYDVEEGTRQSARMLMVISGASLFLSNMAGMFVVGIFRSGGDVAFATAIDSGPLWFIGLPLVAVSALVFHLPITQVYLLGRLSVLLQVFVGMRRFVSRKWIHSIT